MEEAYREYVTTSPRYHLLARADAAVRTLAGAGEEELGRAIARTRRAEGGAARRAARPRPHGRPGAGCARSRAHVAGCDLVKTTLGLSRYALLGLRRRRALVERGIVIEKAGVQHDHADHDLPARRRRPCRTRSRRWSTILGGRVLPGGARRADAGQPVPRDRRPAGDAPLRGAALREVDRPRGPAARGGRQGRGRGGRGLPAGIPLILEGFRVSRDAVEYLARRARGAARSSRATRRWRRCGCCRP